MRKKLARDRKKGSKALPFKSVHYVDLIPVNEWHWRTGTTDVGAGPSTKDGHQVAATEQVKSSSSQKKRKIVSRYLSLEITCKKYILRKTNE